jgi:tryptophan synthase beta chain
MITSDIVVPDAWYNVLADRQIELPPPVIDGIRPAGEGGIRPNIPRDLIRQGMPLRARVPIPSAVLDAYREWRPTPLRRAARLEAALGAHCPIYYKYEAGNIAGTHKYLTALAQAYYYGEAGVRTLVTSTAAGQWGTAIAAAARRFGMRCKIYMVPGSYDRKEGRRTVMELLGATVIRSSRGAGRPASLRDAMSEAVGETRLSADAATRWIIGGNEPFAVLHSTVIGLEAREQLASATEQGPLVVTGYLGGGKSIGGLALPLLASCPGTEVRVAESSAYPVLTRGTAAYDSSDDTGLTPKVFTHTLGERFSAVPIRAEGMRYRSAPPLISALYRDGVITAADYDEDEVFGSARLFFIAEGILPSAEAAYAVHDACVQARDPRNRGRVIVFCLSDHGYYDTDAYRACARGERDDRSVAEPAAHLPGDFGASGDNDLQAVGTAPPPD